MRGSSKKQYEFRKENDYVNIGENDKSVKCSSRKTDRNGIQFLSLQQTVENPANMESLDDIFRNIVGAVSDTGKTLDECREERIKERYETVN